MVALKTGEADAFLKRGERTQRILLVYGPDAGLVRERVDTIVRQAVADPQDPFSLARLDDAALAEAPERLVEEALTVPLFGGRRAVWIKAGSRNIAPAVEALLAAGPPADCTVVIEAGDLKRNAPLRSVCERSPLAAAIPCYPDETRDLGRLIDDEMAQSQLAISADARALLQSLIGGDRIASRGEIRKLALYARDKGRVDLDDVLAVVADASVLALDAIVAAAFAGNAREVETQFAKAREAGTAAAAIATGALRHVMQLHRAKLALEAGASTDEALRNFQPAVHFRRKPQVEAALRAWSAARLQQVMALFAETELESRRRAPLADAIVERALLQTAQAARRKEPQRA